MTEDAIREFDLDPVQCVLFGDKPWDVVVEECCGIFSELTESVHDVGGL